MRLSSLVFIFIAFICPAFAENGTSSGAPASPLLQKGNARVVLVGDSITGQSRNHPAGYAHQMDWALEQAYPGCHPHIIALGGSGQGVQAWLNTEKRSRTDSFPLDVKGIDVKTELDQPTDVLIVMLGMNDVLAPYVWDEPASWEKWSANYRELVTSLQSRLKPKITAVATATMCTEDETSPKNEMIRKLNEHLQSLAQEMGLLVLPTHATMLDVLRRGRHVKADFHVTHDYVHPNEAGHQAIAIAMLRGLDGEKAARAIEEQKLAKILNPTSSAPVPVTIAPSPAPWVVTAGFVRKPWNDRQPPTGATFHGPVEDAIEHGRSPLDVAEAAPGQKLDWEPYQASINFTGGANPDSVDFAAVTHARPFEAGYGARWIRSDRERPVNVELSTQAFAGTPYLEVWLNGKSIYSGLIAGEPGKKKTVPAQLHGGWNTLAFALNHVTWQMQCTVHLAGVGDDSLSDLQYSINAQEAETSTKRN
ncbi:lipolytic protein G-D-S-L family [Chthoniobacter flavus Ellin428]|uniref:Lipolytic protein G-D-S-L family n=1 Tax=Chthoniobacter flavus Ellin428 TaxID=497964 RepID=B4D901_9BACT|nr:GDSL-type esterase/lipase family protein [Chthoniobacter flavus]EDY17046.1 lipolytic protein G-D-S-L family [Chthoniobacter flavus Ellin428]TCO86188.1 lysophospholipase L1-like esterase [Chthoniobacter flavus]